MLKINDKKLQIISIIIAFLTLSVAIYIFFFSLKKDTKNLEATVLSENNLIDYDLKNFDKNLSIKYNDNEIPNVSIINLQLINTGGQPILPQDYIEPIKIFISNSQKIISAKMISSEPANLNIGFTIDSSTIILTPILLNSEDSFIIQINSIPNSLKTISKVKEINCRITNIKKININYSSSKEKGSNQLLLGIISTIISSISLLLLIYLGSQLYSMFKRLRKLEK